MPNHRHVRVTSLAAPSKPSRGAQPRVPLSDAAISELRQAAGVDLNTPVTYKRPVDKQSAHGQHDV